MPKMRIGFDEIQPQQVSYEDGISSIDTVKGGEYEDQIGISDGFLPPETQTRGCCAYCSSRTNMDFHQAGCNIFIQCRVYHSWKSHNFLQHQISQLSNICDKNAKLSKQRPCHWNKLINTIPTIKLPSTNFPCLEDHRLVCITAVSLLNQANLKITLVYLFFKPAAGRGLCIKDVHPKGGGGCSR